MNDEQIIEKMAQAMAESLRDEAQYYMKPARAAFYVAKDCLAPTTETEQARAGARPQEENQHG
jgi:hypothetical protein